MICKNAYYKSDNFDHSKFQCLAKRIATRLCHIPSHEMLSKRILYTYYEADMGWEIYMPLQIAANAPKWLCRE